MVKVRVVKRCPEWSGWVSPLDDYAGQDRIYDCRLHSEQYERKIKDYYVVLLSKDGRELWNFPLASLELVDGSGVEFLRMQLLMLQMRNEA